jgi:L,D-peptidoglycan transpeptidase YkuD (ErfK/YbiS/YcfS/YnhG family)
MYPHDRGQMRGCAYEIAATATVESYRTTRVGVAMHRRFLPPNGKPHMKKFFAPLLKTSVTTVLAAAVLVLGFTYALSRRDVKSTKARPVATFQQDTGNARQVIVVRAKGFETSDATVEAQEFDGSKWNVVIGPVKAKIGRNGFSASHFEGDGTSPQGVFDIKEAFGSQKPLDGMKLPYKKTDLNSWWVSDPDSPEYNKPMAGPPAGRWRESFGERLADSKYATAYRYAAVIEYNRDPVVKGKGSAIFLHVGGKDATSGCVAIAESELIRILKWLDPSQSPKIVMGTESWLLEPTEGPAVTGTAPVGLRVTTPTRILDTREGIGAPAKKVGPKSITTLRVRGEAGVPTDATVVALNVTIVGPSLETFLTVSPSGPQPLPTVSNLNAHAGDERAALVLARIGADGAVRIANDAGDTHLIADVVAYGSPLLKGGLDARDPSRVLDTRIGIGMQDTAARAPIGANTVLDLPLNGVPAGATAVIMNVTATGATQPTFLTAYAANGAAADIGRPNISTVNVRPKQDTANLAIVPLGVGNVVRFYNSAGTTHLIADVFGFVLGDRGDLYVPAEEPVRIVDTRSGVGARGQITTDPISMTVKGLPTTATAIAITLTGVNASGDTDLRVAPNPAETTANMAPFSNVNLREREPTANLVVVKVGKPGMRDDIINRSGKIDVIVDVSGWFVSRP